MPVYLFFLIRHVEHLFCLPVMVNFERRHDIRNCVFKTLVRFYKHLLPKQQVKPNFIWLHLSTRYILMHFLQTLNRNNKIDLRDKNFIWEFSYFNTDCNRNTFLLYTWKLKLSAEHLISLENTLLSASD